MKIPRCFLPPCALAALWLGSSLIHAQDAQATAESRMRDALRNTMLQLRDAQGQVATLQASQAQSDADNTVLKAKIDALASQVASLVKQASDDKAVSDKTIADLKAENAGQVTQIGKLNDALAAWEKDDKQYVQLAKGKEAARAQLAGQVILMQRTIDDRERKNLALYSLGNEILTRYENYGLGEALAAREPFTGLTRVKLQELVQDYRDKVADQRVTPGKATDSAPVPSAAASEATHSVGAKIPQSSSGQAASASE